VIHLKLANYLLKILKLGEVHSKNVSRPSLVSFKKKRDTK